MINAIIESISIALNAEFGDRYKNYREAKKQDLEEPCFFIQCINPTQKLFLGKKYFRNNLFCVQYFPETADKEEECCRIGERLFDCLEYLTVNGDSVRGTKMHYEVVDDILHFFVNYDMYVYKVAGSVPVMGGVSAETSVKGVKK